MKKSRLNTIIGNSLAFLLLTSQMTIAMDRMASLYKLQTVSLAARSTTASELKPALNDHIIQGVESSNESIRETALEKSSVILEDSSSWTSSSTMIQTQQLVAKVSKAKKAPGHPEDESDANRFSILVANGLKMAEEANVLSNQISSGMLEIVNESFASKDESVQTAYQKILPSFYQSAQSILQSDSPSKESTTESIKFLKNYNQDIDAKKIKIDHQEAQKVKNEMARSLNAFVGKEVKKNKVKKDKVNPAEYPSFEGYSNSEQYPDSNALADSVAFFTQLGQSTIFDEDLQQDILSNIEAIKQSGNQVDNLTLTSLVDTLNDDAPLDLSSLFGGGTPDETDGPLINIEENYKNYLQKPTKNKDIKRPVKVLSSDSVDDVPEIPTPKEPKRPAVKRVLSESEIYYIKKNFTDYLGTVRIKTFPESDNEILLEFSKKLGLEFDAPRERNLLLEAEPILQYNKIDVGRSFYNHHIDEYIIKKLQVMYYWYLQQLLPKDVVKRCGSFQLNSQKPYAGYVGWYAEHVKEAPKYVAATQIINIENAIESFVHNDLCNSTLRLKKELDPKQLPSSTDFDRYSTAYKYPGMEGNPILINLLVFEECPVLEITHQYVKLPDLHSAILNEPKKLSLDVLTKAYRVVVAAYAKREFKLATIKDLRFSPSASHYHTPEEAQIDMIKYFDAELLKLARESNKTINEEGLGQVRDQISCLFDGRSGEATLNKEIIYERILILIERNLEEFLKKEIR